MFWKDFEKNLQKEIGVVPRQLMAVLPQQHTIYSVLWFHQFCSKNEVTVFPQSHNPPDMTPYDFLLFPKVKSVLKGHCFDTISVLKQIRYRHYEKILLELCKVCN